MGIGYTLVNGTKREQIAFLHVGVEKAREIAGDPAAAAIVAWYLLTNLGDHIAFVSDTYDDWPFCGSRAEMLNYPDRTDSIITELINEGILVDKGYSYQDPEEPETVYTRDLRIVRMGEV